MVVPTTAQASENHENERSLIWLFHGKIFESTPTWTEYGIQVLFLLQTKLKVDGKKTNWIVRRTQFHEKTIQSLQTNLLL